MRADDRRPGGGPGRRRTGQGRQEQGRELELCAIEEDFATQWRAGRAPRLSDYCERFPEHTAALAGLTTVVASGFTPVNFGAATENRQRGTLDGHRHLDWPDQRPL